MSSLLYLWVTHLRASTGPSATSSMTMPGGRLLLQRGSGSRGGSSRFPLAHDVLDRLSLLLCCRELLGKDMGAFRNCTFSCSFMSVRHSRRWRSWTTSVDITRSRDYVITFVARSARFVAACSSCRTARS